jgi:hypothetical protein
MCVTSPLSSLGEHHELGTNRSVATTEGSATGRLRQNGDFLIFVLSLMRNVLKYSRRSAHSVSRYLKIQGDLLADERTLVRINLERQQQVAVEMLRLSGLRSRRRVGMITWISRVSTYAYFSQPS